MALLGGVAGLLLAWWALAAAPMLGLDQMPRGDEIAIDLRVVAFTLTLVVAVGAVMAVLPIGALRRINLAQVVREEGRSGHRDAPIAAVAARRWSPARWRLR